MNTINDAKIVELLDNIVEERSRYTAGSSVDIRTVKLIDALVAHIKENY